MRKALVILAVVALMAMMSTASFAQYVLVNDDNPTANSVEVFQVSSAGAFKWLMTLPTGGTGLGGGYFAAPRNAIEKSGNCFFVSDAASSDIAAFKQVGGKITKVATNFSNPQLSGAAYGIGMVADAAGKYLYTAWSASLNLATLAIASDCSLTLVGSPISQPDYVADVTLSPPLSVAGGKQALTISYPNAGGAQAYLTSSSGSLTAVGPELVFSNVISGCSSVGCYPTAQDVTNDGQYWIWGNATLSGPYALSAKLTAKGFTNAALQGPYTNSTLQNIEVPWYSPAGAKGNGNLYLGASGFGTGYPAGIAVLTATNGTYTYDSAAVNNSAYYAGQVTTVGTTGTGSPVVQIGSDSSANNTLYSYTVSGTTLTPASSIATKVPGGFALSIAAWKTRP